MAPHRSLVAARPLVILFCFACVSAFGDDKARIEIVPADGRLLRIQIDGLWGYCDALGRVVIKPKFRWAQDFSDGMALVANDNKLAYIDRSGSVVIEPSFTHDHSPFVN